MTLSIKQDMERRKERRFVVSKNVTLKVLAAFPGPSRGHSVNASVINFSGNGMRLRMQFPVACGASVEIADQTTLILGTVCSCIPQDDAHLIGVRILEYRLPTHGHAQVG